MDSLIIATATVLLVSCFCSLLEAVLYALPVSQIELMAREGTAAGKLLKRFYEDIDRPISAILSLNTLANTGGAAIAGAAFVEVVGGDFEIYFTIGISLGVLVFSEILPKTTGVLYARSLGPRVARPIQILVWIFAPLIWLNRFITRIITRNASAAPTISAEEVRISVRMGREAGVVAPEQEKAIQNILSLNDVRARDLMTPRTVVFSLDRNLTLDQARQKEKDWSHSRVPLYDANRDTIVGIVLRRDVFTALADGKGDLRLADLGKDVYHVPEQQRGNYLLSDFLKRQEHLFVVMDEYGAFSGVITLEDVLEEIVGEEIVGEFDPEVDMQEAARRRRFRPSRR
jgi:CBS domain containing-hemolysin-like protein